MARNEILQVVVFSLFFATGLSALGKAGEPLIEILDIVFHGLTQAWVNKPCYVKYMPGERGKGD